MLNGNGNHSSVQEQVHNAHNRTLGQEDRAENGEGVEQVGGRVNQS